MPDNLVTFIHHKGNIDTADYPANSLETIRASLEAGAKFIEVDIIALKEGDYLLVHDADLSSETTGQGQVNETTPEQAMSLYFKEDSSIRVPLLSEVVKLFQEFPDGAGLQLDFKNYFPLATNEPLERLLQIIQPIHDRVIVSTPADWQLRRLHHLDPTLDLGFDILLYLDWRGDHPPSGQFPPFRKNAYDYLDDSVLGTMAVWPTSDYLADRCKTLVSRVQGVSTFYIRHTVLIKSLDDGFNWAKHLAQYDIKLTAWTLDADHPMAVENAKRLYGAGVHHFTTNTPLELERLLSGM